MPPTHTDEGLKAALEIRERFPETGVLVLSAYVEEASALELLSDDAAGIGYLLKDRVSDVDRFTEAVRRVGGAAGRPVPKAPPGLPGRPPPRAPPRRRTRPGAGGPGWRAEGAPTP